MQDFSLMLERGVGTIVLNGFFSYVAPRTDFLLNAVRVTGHFAKEDDKSDIIFAARKMIEQVYEKFEISYIAVWYTPFTEAEDQEVIEYDP